MVSHARGADRMVAVHARPETVQMPPRFRQPPTVSNKIAAFVTISVIYNNGIKVMSTPIKSLILS